MSGGTVPAQFGRLRSLRAFIGIGGNPTSTLRHLHAENGRYFILHYPHSRRAQPQILACVADPRLYRTVASNLDVWRSVNVNWRLHKSLAINRLCHQTITRLRGARHAHYRRLLALPLSKPAVARMNPDMTAIARRNVESWPRDQIVDLLPLAGDLMQDFAISLLFGDDRTRALPVAEMIRTAAAAAWPVPGRAFLKWLRTAPKLERAINAWAEEKRGDVDPRDIFSILVNNADEKGEPPSPETVGSILTFTFGAAYETCQNALAWTLILLTQHPEIAAALTEEIESSLGAGVSAMEKIGSLPLLDGVIKEATRLFPPVPLLFRRSLVETELGAVAIPAGMRVLISVYLINRDPDLYVEPNRFMPERWRGLSRSAYEHPVFGAGGRACPGALFGNQMVKLALAAILLAHRVELAPRAHIDHRITITLAPHPGVPVVLRDRARASARTRFSGSIHELVDLPGGV